MKVKNISKKDLAIPGIGIVKAGEIINVPKGFYNANFEVVGDKKVEKKVEKKIDKNNK